MTDAELSRLLLGLVCLLALALGFGRFFERLFMPPVIGDIAAGLLLGPSVLGLVLPDAHAWLFRSFPIQEALLSAFYWIGLILLMFVAGFRVQRDFTRDDRKTVAVMLFASIVLPMLGGWYLTLLLDPARMMSPAANPLAFHLVLAIGTAVTSIPVISRIFIDLDLINTRFAKIVLATATLQDVVLWTVLAIATGIASGQDTKEGFLIQTVVTTLVFLGLSVVLGPPLLAWIGRWVPIRRDTPALVGYTLLVCFALAAAASLLHINVIFGALIAGIVIGTLPHDRFAEVKQRISDVALWFFVPLYFAIVGLKIDLPQHFDLHLTIVFVLASSALKFGSVALALLLTGKPLSTSVNYGIAMNTRGGPGIVLASVAHAFGIINDAFFVTLVLASITTSLFTGAWLRWAVRRGYAFGA
jgi:Kef-type K+ transport system membrane component KefB